MMAVRSPLPIISYHDTSGPYAGSDSMSFESPSSSVRNSISSAPDENSVDETNAIPAAPTSDGTKLDKSRDDEDSVEATPVQESAPSSQPGLTIQTSHSYNNGYNTRSDDDEPPQSVIHAPPGFRDFAQGETQEQVACDDGSLPSSQHAQLAIVPGKARKIGNSPISPPPLTTTVAPPQDWSERATPRAQTRHEFEGSGRRTRSSSLEGENPFIISCDTSTYTSAHTWIDIPEGNFSSKDIEINALRTALAECWTLCNTLASLSYINRERILGNIQDGMEEDAWRSCWRLCQKLYDTREDDFALQVNPTLDLCREFCQALFEVRSCDNDLTDSVLRVSFELNNHLYNTHDRNLPDAFRERTLDFYITLCHRLMKQRTRLTATDALLSACWTLAEMLFSIRQSKREGKRLDEELLGSAVQACWELCDIFREGWTLHSMRNSDRGTPRPSQTTFAQAFQQAAQQSELDFVDESMQLGNPETPTTIFEDTATVSPDEASVPNILVLGHGHGHSNGHGHSSHPKWPSGASSISENSRSSGHTASSANTVTTASEDPNFTRLKVLVTKAAVNSGYQPGNSQNLSSFVKSLPSDAFGSAPWQTSLLKHYRKLVAFDPAFRSVGSPARVSAIEVARACQAMLQSGQYSWLRDLYRLVFGFHMEEAMGRKGVTIQT
ncbi:uncharacterized protein N7503_002749 [Penicillium pulvis]|uniref:uncharacterized protein n=1 Tax=Penicillium pulvis TaxID=1562058 RepID=UPI002547D45B|nr:uncharacterized protein N7503_002749 [Penicillium pulvis]KAJ5810531.1 hypothetical protein N7503_002749 [Penicillium pulvis]